VEARVQRKRQALNRCTFVSPRLWRDAKYNERHEVDAAYMGGELDADENETIEPNDEGCPGGWYRTLFFASLQRYLRPVADGIYSANQNLERTDDRLVIDAVQAYEVEQSRARAWANQRIDEHFRG
jgi:hypothetical protein